MSKCFIQKLKNKVCFCVKRKAVKKTKNNKFQLTVNATFLITPHAPHQIKDFTQLNDCSVDSLNIQGYVHCQSVSSDQSAKSKGIQQQYRMLQSPCRGEQTVSAMHPENILCSATSSLLESSKKHILLETFFFCVCVEGVVFQSEAGSAYRWTTLLSAE